MASFFNLSRSQTQSFYNRTMKRKKKGPAPWAVSGHKSQPDKSSPSPPPIQSKPKACFLCVQEGHFLLGMPSEAP